MIFFILSFSLLFAIIFLRVALHCFLYEKGRECVNKFLLLNERKIYEAKKYMPNESQIDDLADFFQNLSDSTRLKILSCLSLFDMCVNDICTLLSINQTTISHQLKILKTQEIVASRREGKIIIYSLKERIVQNVLSYASESL